MSASVHLWYSGQPDDPGAARPSPSTTVLGERWFFSGSIAAGQTRVGHDQLLDAPVRLLAFDREDTSVRERALTMLRATHPSVAHALSMAPLQSVDVLILEAIEGRTAEEAAAEGPLDPMRVAEIGVELFDAMAWLHDHGLVHGAIDGEAVVLQSDRAMLDALPLRPGRTRPVEDVQCLARVLRGLLAGALPMGDSAIPLETPWPLVRALTELADGRIENAGVARDLLARVRRQGPLASDPGRPVRRPPWADVRPPVARATPTGPVLKIVPAVPRPALQVVSPPAPAALRSPPKGMVRVTTGPGSTPFFLDTAPVTNAMWLEWLEATDHTPPAHWIGRRIPTGREKYPIVGVSLAEARAYAAWRHARLPTEAEWMTAAQGPSVRRTFPWGERACGSDTCTCVRMGSTGVEPVCAHPANATPDGVFDLLGNVWEWVDGEPTEAGRAVALGGSFRHACKEPGQIPRTELGAESTYLYVGFRCAVSPSEAA